MAAADTSIDLARVTHILELNRSLSREQLQSRLSDLASLAQVRTSSTQTSAARESYTLSEADFRLLLESLTPTQRIVVGFYLANFVDTIREQHHSRIVPLVNAFQLPLHFDAEPLVVEQESALRTYRRTLFNLLGCRNRPDGSVEVPLIINNYNLIMRYCTETPTRVQMFRKFSQLGAVSNLRLLRQYHQEWKREQTAIWRLIGASTHRDGSAGAGSAGAGEGDGAPAPTPAPTPAQLLEQVVRATTLQPDLATAQLRLNRIEANLQLELAECCEYYRIRDQPPEQSIFQIRRSMVDEPILVSNEECLSLYTLILTTWLGNFNITLHPVPSTHERIREMFAPLEIHLDHYSTSRESTPLIVYECRRNDSAHPERRGVPIGYIVLDLFMRTATSPAPFYYPIRKPSGSRVPGLGWLSASIMPPAQMRLGYLGCSGKLSSLMDYTRQVAQLSCHLLSCSPELEFAPEAINTFPTELNQAIQTFATHWLIHEFIPVIFARTERPMMSATRDDEHVPALTEEGDPAARQPIAQLAQIFANQFRSLQSLVQVATTQVLTRLYQEEDPNFDGCLAHELNRISNPYLRYPEGSHMECQNELMIGPKAQIQIAQLLGQALGTELYLAAPQTTGHNWNRLQSLIEQHGANVEEYLGHAPKYRYLWLPVDSCYKYPIDPGPEPEAEAPEAEGGGASA